MPRLNVVRHRFHSSSYRLTLTWAGWCECSCRWCFDRALWWCQGNHDFDHQAFRLLLQLFLFRHHEGNLPLSAKVGLGFLWSSRIVGDLSLLHVGIRIF